MAFASIRSHWRQWCVYCCCAGFFVLSGSTVHAAMDVRLDRDGDGLLDVWETQVFHTDPDNPNTDGDRYRDGEEVRSGYDPRGNGRLVEQDVDQDELSDRLELLFGTDPLIPDTDGDGHTDGAEVYNGFSPTTTQPVPLPKTIRVHLNKQYLEQTVMGVALKAHKISGGLPRTPTPTGTFQVLNKNPRAWSNSAKLWMPYWMHFSGRGHGLHELPEWPSGRKEGANHLGRPASHGCIRLGIGSARRLYEWAPLGTPVVITRT